MRLVAVIVLALGACIDDPNVICGAIACPQGSVCTSLGCASPSQLTACVGAATNDPCTTAAISSGACTGSDNVCEPIVCGDGIVVGPEVCDDGNQQGGDGCSADCRSDETCGNGIVDGIVGEQCDDGPPIGLSHDGCSSNCQIEIETWVKKFPSTPHGRNDIRMAWDAVHRRALVFGGLVVNSTAKTYLGDTWLLADTYWTRVVPTISPSARADYALAWDSNDNQIVLYGGVDGVPTHYTDTWAWTGKAWTQLAATSSLPSAADASPLMAFDGQRGRLVLALGGHLVTWNSSTAVWEDEYQSLPIPAGGQRELAYDGADQKLVVYTYDTTAKAGATYWYTFAPATWTATQMTGAVPSLSDATLASVPVGVDLVGTNPASGALETWQLTITSNVGTWTQVAGTAPPVRTNPALAYDTYNMQLDLFGGYEKSTFFDDVWNLSAQDWVQAAMSGGPSARRNASLAFAPELHGSLLYGGTPTVIDGLANNETWQWDGQDWQLRLTTSDPGARYGYAMVATNPGAVLVGGQKAPADTWKWNESLPGWEQVAGATFSGTLFFAAAAYDMHRDRVVLVGGATGSNADVACSTLSPLDVGTTDAAYEFDGQTWTQIASGPPARARAAIAYDATHRQTVVFGGCAEDGTRLGDTWTWDGAQWTQLSTTALAPSPREGAAMTYDGTRGVVILNGGNDKVTALDDTWLWDGTQWIAAPTLDRPSERQSHAMTYDAIQLEAMSFGWTNEVWVHRWENQQWPPDDCTGGDSDHDGLVGCNDPDCWGSCVPYCPPRASCP